MLQGARYARKPGLIANGGNVNPGNGNGNGNGVGKGGAGGGSGGNPNIRDPYFDLNLALLHLNGTNGGTVFTDQMGNTVSAFGGVTTSTTQSKFGGASASFDGVDDYLSITSGVFNTGTEAFTMEAWVYLNNNGAGGFGNLASSGDGFEGCSFWLTGAGAFRIRMGKSVASGFDDVLGVGTLNTGQWYHIAVVREGVGANQLKLYVDGILNAQGTSTRTMNPAGIALGRAYLAASSDYLNGYIDDFRFTRNIARYTTTFTPPSRAFPDAGNDPYFSSVASLLYMNGSNGGTTFTDEKGKTVTRVGATTSTGQIKYGSASAIFNGTTDGLTLPNGSDFDFGSGDFTIEFWTYLNSVTGSHGFVSKRATTAAQAPFNIYQVGTSLFADFYNGTTSISLSGSVLTIGPWRHICVMRRGNTFSLIYNGGLVQSNTLTGTLFTNTAPVSIGSSAADQSESLSGYLDDVRFTKGTARYGAGFIPPVTQLPNS